MVARSMLRPASIVACMLAMAAIGLLVATYGPAISAFKAGFGIDDAQAGGGLALQSAAVVVGVLTGSLVLRQVGNRHTMHLALGLMGVGALGLALAPSWPMLLAAAVVAGLGIGGCDPFITQLLILGAGTRGPALVNVAHGFFGIGTVLSPAVLSVIGTDRYGMVFAVAAGACAIALLGTRRLDQRPTPADARTATGPAAAPAAPTQARPDVRARRPFAGLVLAGFVALFVMHFGVQFGIGTWEPTYLESLSFSASAAALATSGFWLAMVLGRFIAAFLTRSIAIPALVIISCVGVAVSLALAMEESFAVSAFVLCGFFIGPIFPNALTWLATTGLAHGHRFAWLLAGSKVTNAVVPWLLGIFIGARGAQVVPPTLLVIAVGAVLASLALAAATSRGRRGLGTTSGAEA